MSDLTSIMALLSFLAANKGVSLRDAARATGLSVRDICTRLDSISLCGVPPYSPHDYISYRLIGQGDDAIIDLQYAQHFAKPLAFTTNEALALKYSLEHFARAADDESTQQVRELTTVLANALQGRARDVLAGSDRGFVVPRQTARIRALMGTISDAIDGRWVTVLDYYSSHRARIGKRRVHPYQMLEIGAHFYLYAFCELAGATRHFRLERIRSAETADDRYERRPPARKSGRMAGLFEGKPRDKLRVQFSAEVARDVADEWRDSPGAEIHKLPDDRMELAIPLYNPQWAAGFVTAFGPHAKLIGPKWLKAEIAQSIRSTLQAHR